MSKRNIAYIKPEEPNFLKRLKKEIGYKEEVSIESKREILQRGPEDLPELEDSEVPQIVVLAPGDLSADQVQAEQARIQKEKDEKPADLTQRVIFKPRGKSQAEDKPKAEKRKKEKTKTRPTISFDDDCDED